MEFVENLSIASLDAGGLDPASALWRAWRDNGGLMTEALLPLHPHLIYNSCTIPDQDLPEILFLGGETLARRIYGANAIKDTSFRQIPDVGLRMGLRHGYLTAAAGEPAFDYVALTVTPTPDEATEISYERLILPFHTGGGMEMFATLCTPIQDYRPKGRSNPKGRAYGYTPASYRAAAGGDWNAIVCRPDIDDKNRNAPPIRA